MKLVNRKRLQWRGSRPHARIRKRSSKELLSTSTYSGTDAVMAIFERTSEGILLVVSPSLRSESTAYATKGTGEIVGAMTRKTSISHRFARTVRGEGNHDGKSEFVNELAKQAK